ncbi:hypothetical protein D3C85_600620 [compost metagenome]
MAEQHRAVGLQHRAPVGFKCLGTLQDDRAHGVGQLGRTMLDRLIGPGHSPDNGRLGDQPAASQREEAEHLGQAVHANKIGRDRHPVARPAREVGIDLVEDQPDPVPRQQTSDVQNLPVIQPAAGWIMQVAEHDRPGARLDRRPNLCGRDGEGVGRPRQVINGGPGRANDLVQDAETGGFHQDPVAGLDQGPQRLRHAVAGPGRRQHLIRRHAIATRNRMDQPRIAATKNALEVALISGVEDDTRGLGQQGHRLLDRALEQAARLAVQRHAPIEAPHPGCEIRDAVQRLARVKIRAGRVRMRGRGMHADLSRTGGRDRPRSLHDNRAPPAASLRSAT